MKSILMTSSAVLLATGFAGQAQAACPEDIDAFNRQYEETLQTAAAGEALSTSEQAQLFGLRTAAENLYRAGNAEMCAEVIQRAQLTLDTAIAPQIIKPSELVGREVVNAQDENLGEIEDVMLDPTSGRIAYVVIEHGGFLGIGDNLFAVPWRAMQFVPGSEETVLLDIPEEKLENAPRFSREDETPLERREWVTSVHAYYGVEPYWQDNVGAMAMQYGGGGDAASAATDGSGAGTETQTGDQSSGETTTIVVPVTTTGSDDQSQSQEEQPQSENEQPQTEDEQSQTQEGQSGTQEGQSATEGEQAQPAGDGSQTGAGGQQDANASTQSAAGQQTGAANLVGTQSAETSGAGSEEINALVSRIDQLEQQIQSLSQQVPGEEVAQSISRLEEQVQQLTEQMPGEEMQQQIARIEEQIAALGQADAGAAGQETGGTGQSEQPAAIVVVPDQNTQSGEQQAGQQQTEQEQEPQQEQQAAQQPTGEQQTDQQQGGMPEQTGAASEQSGQAQDQDNPGQGSRTVIATPMPITESDAGSGLPCEEMIAQLEEDLQRAEELGVAIDDAVSEFEEAQAMLNNNSEALCRAAIKRAHEELVAVGFEPTELN